jgi:alkylhydroperoxidase/carboxymuconolactone decarboxylase family protein YurZ
MEYGPKAMLEDFNRLMVDIKKTIPVQYDAFISEKEKLTKGGKIPEKTKWLLLLVAAVSQRCPVCIPRAVKHCLEQGYTKEEMLEACMVAVLVGGSSAMTYVTFVAQAIDELRK